MEFLTALWLPILLSAVFIFVASSIIHMAIPIHKGDFKKLPQEENVMNAIRQHGVAPGEYMFPCAGSMKEMGTPEMTAKYNQGPVGFLTILPNGPCNIGKSLIQWFLYTLLISVFIGYAAHVSLNPGARTGEIVRIVGTLAILAYALPNIVNSIWKGVGWSVTAKFIFDGVVYTACTAAAFTWFWPVGM